MKRENETERHTINIPANGSPYTLSLTFYYEFLPKFDIVEVTGNILNTSVTSDSIFIETDNNPVSATISVSNV